MYLRSAKYKIQEILKSRKKNKKEIVLNLDYQICFDRRIKEEVSLIKNCISVVFIATVPQSQFPNLTDLSDNLNDSLLLVSNGFLNNKAVFKIFSKFFQRQLNPIIYYFEALFFVFNIKPKIIVLHDLPAFKLLAKTLFFIRKYIPFINFRIYYDAHELYASQPQIDPDWINVERKAVQSADKIICVTKESIPFYKKYLKSYDLDKFVILDNGINYERIDPIFKKIILNKENLHKINTFPRSKYGWQDSEKILSTKNSIKDPEKDSEQYKTSITNSLRINNIKDSNNSHNKSIPIIKLIYAGNTNLERNIQNVLWAVDNVNLHYENSCEKKFKLIFSIYTSEVPNKFFKICNQLAFPERIIFNSLIPQNTLINYFIRSNIGVLPYVPFDFNTITSKPNKMFEYIYAKLPFIYDENLTGVNEEIKLIKNKFAFSTNMQIYEDISSTLISIIESSINYNPTKHIDNLYESFNLNNRANKYKEIFDI